MIPGLLYFHPALFCMIAARCAAAYWQTVAEVWGIELKPRSSAEILPFPSGPHHPTPTGRGGSRAQVFQIVRVPPPDLR